MTSAATRRQVGRYELLHEVGRGGTAVVYLARQADLDRSVALKELAGLHASDPAFIERFLRESRVAGSLNHPNIVTVHEFFEHEGTAYIAMEYFERGSLRSAMQSLTVPQIGGVLEGVLGGLAHAHQRGIVHRDLKPENVMVTSSGGVKVADFGVAKVLHDEAGPLTTSGTTLGTPAYMAPEQALASGVGPPADLYAVGVVAYEMLTGDVPFRGSDVAMAIMLQHLNESVPALLAANPELDPALCSWVERLLAKQPEDRPGSAADASDGLDEILIAASGARWRRGCRLTGSYVAAEPQAESAATNQLDPTRVLPRRRRRAVALALGVVLAGALAAAGVALAVDLTRNDDGTATERPSVTETVETTTDTPPPAAALLRRVALTSGDPVTARLRLTGKPLGSGSIRVHDDDLSDGAAWFEIVQPGISARTQGAVNDDLRVRIRKAKGRLRVDLATDGNLDRARIRRIDGRTVLVTITRPPAQVSTGSTSGGTTTDTTPTTSTTPKTKPRQEPGLLPSG